MGCGVGECAQGEGVGIANINGLAAENATIRTKTCGLMSFVETLGRERKEVVILTQNLLDFMANFN